MNALASVLTLAMLAAPPTPTVEIASAPEEIRVGDPIEIELTVNLPPGSEAEFPELAATWGSAEVRSTAPIRTEDHADGSRTQRQRVTVVLFETGEITLPGPPIRVTDTDGGEQASIIVEPADPVTVFVSSLLPPGEELPEAKPPTPPQPLGVGNAFLWTSGVLGLLSLVLLGLLLRRRLTKAAVTSADVDPLTGLVRALESLRTLPDPEDAIAAISLYFRRFLGNTLAFPAAESTTSEIRGRLRGFELPQPLATRTENLLRHCDGVKYARQVVSPEDVGRDIGEATAIATETIEALSPPPTDEDEAQ